MATRKKKKPVKKAIKRTGTKSAKNRPSKSKVVKKKSAPRKKRSRRDATSFPGLEKRFFSKVKQEYHDIDYAHLLSDKEKAFLNSFMEESLGARLNHPNKKIHRTKKARKEIFGANNARNRDVMSIQTKISSEPGVFIDAQERNSVEDALIALIDSKKSS